jgi:hypothetical protein
MDLKLAFNISHLGRVRNRTISYDKLKEYLKNPTVSPETIEEFLAFPADQQAEMKKKSGFFLGGTSIDGRRRSSSIDQRSVVALDVDTCTPEQLKRIRRGYGPIAEYDWVMHSTRKHTPQKPRVRIIVPLRESVTAEEYEAVARIIAAKLLPDPTESIDIVDPCCFRVAQMMYLPTVCSNGEFVYQENVGSVISGKRHLSFHVGDWRKGENLPVSQKHQQGPVHPGMSRVKLGDPTQKSGLIGAFCRTYDVLEAIERYLPDCYAVSSYDGGGTRLTYLKGTSTDGACVYDNDQYLYSHHHTDPCAGKCVNAFDLVRIHLFGELDAGILSDHLPDLPSFAEMKLLCREDPEVAAELELANFEAISEDFSDFDNADDSEEEHTVEENAEEETAEVEVSAPTPVKMPSFPIDIFGPLWKSELENFQKGSGAPIDYSAGSLLAIAGSLIANARRVSPQKKWKEPPILWMMLIGNPSARKSPSLFNVLEPLEKIEKVWYNDWVKQNSAWEEAKEKAKIIKKNFTGDVANLPKEAMIPPKPTVRRTIVMDATSEALTRLSLDNPRGLLNVRDEIAGWYSGMDRYQNKSGGDRSMWIEAYGGRSYLADRVKDEGKGLRVRHLSIGLLGCIQPDRLKEITRSCNDGLAARIIPIWPENVDCDPADESEIQDSRLTEMAFERLSSLCCDENGDPIAMPLSAAARQIFVPYSRELSRRNRAAEEAAEEISPLHGAYGKASGHILRVANILQHLWWAIDIFGDGPPPQELSAEALNAAIQFREEYLMPMQRRVFADAETSVIQEEAIAVALYLNKIQDAVINVRDLRRETILRRFPKRKADEVLEYCQDQGMLEIKVTRTRGRPKQDVHINKKGVIQFINRNK